MTAPSFTSLGKQVLERGCHYADACNPLAAQAIADALNALPAFHRLHSAAHAYLHASSDRTARLTAEPLRAALADHPTQIGEKA